MGFFIILIAETIRSSFMEATTILKDLFLYDYLTVYVSKFFAKIPPDLILIIICFSIVIFFLIGFYDVFRILHISRKIRKFTKCLDMNNREDNESKKDHLVACSKEHDIIFEETEEFCESIVNDKNVLPAKEFIDPEHILQKNKLNVGFLMSIPGIMLSLGICGTFIGILFALNKSQWDVDFTQQETIIKNLINGAGVAFITSIVGCSCSIIFTIIKRMALRHYEISISLYQSKLDKFFHRLTSEQLLNDFAVNQSYQQKVLDKIAESSEQQVEALQAFSTDLASTIEKSLQKCFEEIKLQSQSGTTELVNSFIEQMGFNFKGQLEGLNEAVKNVFSAQEKSLVFTNSVVENLVEIQGKQSILSEAFKNNIETANDFVTKVKAAISQLEVVSQQFSIALQRIEPMNEAIHKALDFQNEQMKHINENIAIIQQFSLNYSSLKDELNEALLQYGQGIKRGLETTMREFDSELAKGGGYIANWAEGLGEKIEDFTTVLSNAKTMLENNITPLGLTLQDSLKTLGEHNNNLNNGYKEQFDAYVSNLRGVSNKFEEMLKLNFESFSNSFAKIMPSAASTLDKSPESSKPKSPFTFWNKK